MAYLRDLEKCRGCSYRKAVCRLFNKTNSDLGAYCRQCGLRALKQRLREENVVPTVYRTSVKAKNPIGYG